jgi:hypothetical protein
MDKTMSFDNKRAHDKAGNIIKMSCCKVEEVDKALPDLKKCTAGCLPGYLKQ